MTTYDASAVSDSVIAHKKGVTLQQGRALRDNLLAALEGDSSVPDLLKLTIPYGTLATTSGATQALTGLDLTQVNRLFLVFSLTLTASATVSVAGVVASGAAIGHKGIVYVDVQTGIFAANLGSTSIVGDTSITDATTSIAISCGANFNSGSVVFYGVR